MVVTWLPLAYAAEALVLHLRANLREPLWTLPDATVGETGAAMFLAPPASLVFATLAGGYLLGRWGEASGGLEAASAASLAVLFAVGLMWAKSGVMWVALGALLLALPAAVLGASLGRRRRGL
jgi:hypothetical protein